jgi:glycosyltransferase involved in cell wall biosynthesis
MAKVLSKTHQVLLFCSPASKYKPHDDFEVLHYNYTSYKKMIVGAQALLGQCFPLEVIIQAKNQGVKLVLDAYAPEFIEHFEIFKALPVRQYDKILANTLAGCLFGMSHADHVICANDRQKALWLGVLAGRKKIIPRAYKEDSKLSNLISVVPFGISSAPLKKTGAGLAEQFNLPPESKIILWGGGIWNWFDPLTLIRALHSICKKRLDIHLIFMGIKHPNDRIPEMQMTADAIQLAKKLNIYGKNVHFNFGWIPYEDRQNTLLEGHIGASCHFNNLETHFSFRTRILDYLWAEIPIITSDGDVFAEVIKKEQLGIVVPYQDEKALSAAIESLMDNAELRSAMKERISCFKKQFYWHHVVHPLITVLEKPLKKTTYFKKWLSVASVVVDYIYLVVASKIRSRNPFTSA